MATGRTSSWVLPVVLPREAAVEAELDPDGAVAGLTFPRRERRQRRRAASVESGSDAAVLADHVALFPVTGERRVLREVRDGVQDCDADVLAEFITGSLEVRDTDQDDLGEVMFAYRLACRSDVSPAGQKLLVLEDGRKHILRG